MKTFFSLCLSLILCGVASPLLAQFGVSDAFLDKVPTLEMPAVDNDALAREELAQRRPGRPNTFATAHVVNVRPENEGLWTIRNGTATWYLRVRSPGAHSLNLGFSEYRLPAGAELYLGTATEREGPFTRADNEEHNQLWTPILTGDELLIELRIPAESKGKEQLLLTAVNHDFMDVQKSLSGSCNVDVVCDAGDGFPIVDRYRDIIRSVASYSIRGINTCTGFLVNNTSEDGAPLFMTAFHCGVRENDAPTIVTYWNYENSFCRQPGGAQSGSNGNGSRRINNSGSTLLAGFSDSDVTLTLLDDPVNPAADAFYAGWDRRDALPLDTMICVHHPNVEEKRISFSFNQFRRVDFGNGPSTITGNLLEVSSWSIGTTEGGSSGSPIFDRFKRVRGQLFGGQASCGNPGGYDVYGYLAASWTGGGSAASRLSDWLDPCGTGAEFIDGLDNREQDRQILASTGNCSQSCNRVETALQLEIGEAYPAGSTVQIVSADPALNASLSETDVQGGQTVQVTIPADAGRSDGTYALTVRVSGGGFTDEVDLTVTMVTTELDAVRFDTPADDATGVSVITNFFWEAVPGATSYEIELSLNNDFSDPFASGEVLGTAAGLDDPLAAGTTYFWRVRPLDVCGPGEWTQGSFTTSGLACAAQEALDVPVNIPAAGRPTVSSSLDIPFDADLEDMTVNVVIRHSYVGDLSATLTGPDGNSVGLFTDIESGSCNGMNLNLTFNDAATLTNGDLVSTCNNNAAVAVEGTYRAERPLLDAFVNSAARGRWTLTVSDQAGGDGGSIESFSITFCGEIMTSTNGFGEDRAVRVFPNPSSDRVSVEATGTWLQPIEGTLFDATGRRLRSFRMRGAGRESWSVADLAGGVYYLRMRSGREQSTERVVVIR